MYRERSDERYENLFLHKECKFRKRQISPDVEDLSPPRKRSKVTKQKEYIIEKILNFKYVDATEYFFVKWQGYPNSENTWEPIGNLDNCPKVLTKFLCRQEEKYFDEFEKIKQEISFGDLLTEENLIKHIDDVKASDIEKLKDTLLLKLLCIVTLKESEEEHVTQLIEASRDSLQLYILARKRCQQLIALRDWEDHVNQVDKSKKIVIENSVDLTGPPHNFTYINQCIPGQGVVIPDEPPIGCECEACNSRSKICCGTQSGLFAYTVNKRLRVAPGTPIFECNKACKCPSDCTNRVVQHGRYIKLCIFRTANNCGWGVRTEQKIRQGQFLCQYVGEVITFEEAEKRGREYDANGLTYLFDLDFNSIDNPYTVDAAYLGNISHFINHCCEPNLGVWAVWADCLDPNLPMLALFATRDIEAGEELSFDYMQKTADSDVPATSNVTNNSSDTDQASLPNDEVSRSWLPENRQHKNRTECKCGAVNCRKYLF